jgi:hypothetical protein
MLIQLGNPIPAPGTGATSDGAPLVTYVYVPDDVYPVDSPVDGSALKAAADAAPNAVTKGLNEALLAIVHRDGVVANHHAATPSWAWSDNPHVQEALAAAFGCPAGIPDDVEDTHHTVFGPPGVKPGDNPDVTANITQNGRDILARASGGGQVGTTGQATGSGSTSLTDSGASWTTNQWAGCRVFASVTATQMVFANVISNTGTALTVDRWYTVATPGGAAGSTPSSTGTYVIMDGNGPAWFVALTANSSSPASPSTATSLTGEITTASGGLVRKIGVYAHTASAATWTLTPVFTANGSDSLPVTIAKMGVFTSMVVSDTTSTMMVETLLSATATLSTSGDQLTLTWTATTT